MLDLRHFSNEIVWAAVKLNVPTIRALLQENSMPYPEDQAMPLDKKCEVLAALIERVDIDFVQLYQKQEEGKRLPATTEADESKGGDLVAL